MMLSKQQWILWVQWVCCHIAVFFFVPIYSLLIFVYGSAAFSMVGVDIWYLSPFPLFVLGVFTAVATGTAMSAIQWFFVWCPYVANRLWLICSAVAAGIGCLVGMLGWRIWLSTQPIMSDDSGSDRGMYLWVYGGIGALIMMALVQGMLLRRHRHLAYWWGCASVLGIAISAIAGSSIFWWPSPWSILLWNSYGVGYGVLTGSIIARLPVITASVIPSMDRQEW